MSEDYKRGYGKGYRTGSLRSGAAIAAERERADLAALRAERAESATNIGHCEDCRHWLRGGGGPNGYLCAWGVCHAPRAAGTPWGCWAVGNDGKPIHTTPAFGCVLFAPTSAAGASATKGNPTPDGAEATGQSEHQPRSVGAPAKGER